jgi:hypothetical protein
MRLPGGGDVQIEDRKVRGTVDLFLSEIRRLALSEEVSHLEDTPFGRKYTVPGTLVGPVGVVQVVTVWLERPARDGVRLVTVQPR